MTVSVLVVTHDHEDEIDACLDGALAQGDDVEVVVVDNASSDGTADRLRARGDAIVSVLRTDNPGFAASVNEAFARSTGEHVVLLNPDCVMGEGCVRVLREHLDARRTVAMAAALLRNPDGTPQLFARRDHGLATAAWTFTDLGKKLDGRLRGGKALAYRSYADRWEPAAPVTVQVPAAACVMVRRADLAPRPLDEAFPLFFNDADLCRRLRATGRRIEVVPAAPAVHGYATSISKAGQAHPAAMRAEWVISLRRYTARHWSRTPHILLTALLLADALGNAALSVVGRGNLHLARGTLGALGLPGGVAPLLSRR